MCTTDPTTHALLTFNARSREDTTTQPALEGRNQASTKPRGPLVRGKTYPKAIRTCKKNQSCDTEPLPLPDLRRQGKQCTECETGNRSKNSRRGSDVAEAECSRISAKVQQSVEEWARSTSWQRGLCAVNTANMEKSEPTHARLQAVWHQAKEGEKTNITTRGDVPISIRTTRPNTNIQRNTNRSEGGHVGSTIQAHRPDDNHKTKRAADLITTTTRAVENPRCNSNGKPTKATTCADASREGRWWPQQQRSDKVNVKKAF